MLHILRVQIHPGWRRCWTARHSQQRSLNCDYGRLIWCNVNEAIACIVAWLFHIRLTWSRVFIESYIKRKPCLSCCVCICCGGSGQGWNIISPCLRRYFLPKCPTCTAIQPRFSDSCHVDQVVNPPWERMERLTTGLLWTCCNSTWMLSLYAYLKVFDELNWMDSTNWGIQNLLDPTYVGRKRFTNIALMIVVFSGQLRCSLITLPQQYICSSSRGRWHWCSQWFI